MPSNQFLNYLNSLLTAPSNPPQPTPPSSGYSPPNPAVINTVQNTPPHPAVVQNLPTSPSLPSLPTAPSNPPQPTPLPSGVTTLPPVILLPGDIGYPGIEVTSSVNPNVFADNSPPAPQTVSAFGRPFRFLWGWREAAGQIFKHGVKNGYYYVGVIWSVGPIESVTTRTIFGKTDFTGITEEHYLANTGDSNYNTVDDKLLELDATYADTLVGTVFGQTVALAHSVYKIPVDRVQGDLEIVARIQGRKIYDPITTSTIYTSNSALVLGDYLSHPLLGNYTVNWDDTSAVTACSELVGGVARRGMAWEISEQHRVSDMIKVLRTYAGCYVRFQGNEVFLIPDRPRTPSGDITQYLNNLTWRRIAGIDKPNVVRVEYENRSVTDNWRSDYVEVEHPDVVTESLERVIASVPATGIWRTAEAKRFATELLNGYTAADVVGSFVAQDEGLEWEPGDTYTINDTTVTGLSTDIRILEKRPSSNLPGRWAFTFEEYNASKYSDIAISDVTLPDTSLPDPDAIPTPTGVTVTEYTRRDKSGYWRPWLSIAWTPGTYAYRRYYDVEVYDQGQKVASFYNVNPEISIDGSTYNIGTGFVPDSVNLHCRVRAVAANSAYKSTWASGYILTSSPTDTPPNVDGFAASENRGIVTLTWNELVDVGFWRYQIRYGSAGVTWESSGFITSTTATSATVTDLPTGVYDFLIKAIVRFQGQPESSALESDREARKRVRVVRDVESINETLRGGTGVTTTNMGPLQFGRKQVESSFLQITDDSLKFNVRFPNAMSTYTNALQTYLSTSGTYKCVSDPIPFDFGQEIAGQWEAYAPITLLHGDITDIVVKLEISSTASTGPFRPYWGTPGEDVLLVADTGRWARITVEDASSTAKFYVDVGDWAVRAREVNYRFSSGGVPRTHTTSTIDFVTLPPGKYYQLDDFTLSVLRVSAATWTYQNAVIGDSDLNPNFDDWHANGSDELPDHWYNSGPNSLVVKNTNATFYRNAPYSLRLSQNGSDVVSVRTRMFPHQLAGKTFRFSFWLYAFTASSTLDVEIYGYDDTPPDKHNPDKDDGDTPDWTGTLASSASVSTGWNQYSYTQAVPSGYDYFVIQIWKNQVSHTWYIDELEWNLNGVDVYVYNSSGTRVAWDYQWNARVV